MAEANIGCLIVLESDKYVGIVRRQTNVDFWL